LSRHRRQRTAHLPQNPRVRGRIFPVRGVLCRGVARIAGPIGVIDTTDGVGTAADVAAGGIVIIDRRGVGVVEAERVVSATRVTAAAVVIGPAVTAAGVNIADFR
jgi:hypothetical protein